MLTVHAPAKVNLVLEVLGKVDDYHRISSIVQSIDLCDVLTFEPDGDIRFECDEPVLEQDNLVVRAAMLIRERTGCESGARIRLHKRIPWSAGLGGGSSDAAATLLGLNELWRLGLSTGELVGLASELGSDVPFFIHKGTALVEGKGEQVSPLPSLRATYFVLLVPLLPGVVGKTGQMYGRLDATQFTEGLFVRAALTSLREGKMIEPVLMFNAFERVAFGVFAGLDEYAKVLSAAGAPGTHLAGSGPCLFTFFSVEGKARALSLRLSKQGFECYVAASLSPTDVAAGQ